MINFSIVMSSIRPNLWKSVLISLIHNNINIEVIFVGDKILDKNIILSSNIKYTHIVSSVKPSQAYEIGFREAKGELIHWSADEAIYEPNSIDKMYEFYKSFDEHKLITGFTVKENNGKTFSITSNGHFIGDSTTPRMACFGVINKIFMKELGGYDRRFITGQGENDLCLRCYKSGGRIEFNPETIVSVYHTKIDHKLSLFRKWYPQSRKFLEDCWFTAPNVIAKERLIPFEPFKDKNILTECQEPKGSWK